MNPATEKPPPSEFSGRTVLVTGSARNLGFTLARRFARAGACVIIHARSLAEAEEARRRMEMDTPGVRLETAGFPLEDPAAIEAAFAELAGRDLVPDILVNNAAHLGLGADTTFLGQPPGFFEEVIATNLTGAFHCSRQVAARLRDRGRGGSIIHITSLAGERAIWGRSAYCTSKAALEGLARAMALELAQHDIQVNCISAGYIHTPRWETLSPGQVARRRANTPCRGPTRQEEIAELAAFLASRRTPTLIGSRIVIDGGLNIQQLPSDVTV